MKLYYINYKENGKWKTTNYQFADLSKFKDWCALYGIVCKDAEIAEFYISYKDCDGVGCYSKPNKFAHIDDFTDWCKDNGVTKWNTFTNIRLMIKQS